MAEIRTVKWHDQIRRSPSPLVSVITPTLNRPGFLRSLSKCVLSQDVSDFEWLVLDDSDQPSKYMLGLSDPRIKYEHIGERLTIGAKRNYLIGKSRANVIVQFDDDDIYQPAYLSNMMAAMNESGADVVKLFGFYVWNKPYTQFGYWDLTTTVGPHWVWSTKPPAVVMLTEQNNQGLHEIHLGYGFSFVFKKEVWERNCFPEINGNEDGKFLRDAAKSFRLTGLQDYHRVCLHVLHETSSSTCFPQYMLPNFLVRTLFPGADELIAHNDAI